MSKSWSFPKYANLSSLRLRRPLPFGVVEITLLKFGDERDPEGRPDHDRIRDLWPALLWQSNPSRAHIPLSQGYQDGKSSRGDKQLVYESFSE